MKRSGYIFLLVVMLVGTLTSSSFAYETIDTAEVEQETNTEIEKEVNTITIELPYIPWEMPWTNGDVLSIGEQMTIPPSKYNPELLVGVDEYFIYVSHDGDSQPISLEIEVVESLADVPMKPGETTVVTDGYLIYVFRDELQITGEYVNAERYVYLYDPTNALIWHGTIYLYANGVYDGSNVNIAADTWDASVLSSPSASNLTVTSKSLSQNPSAVVWVDADFSVIADSGTTRTGTVFMYVKG